MLQSILAFAIPTVVTLTAAFFIFLNVKKAEEEQSHRFHRNETANRIRGDSVAVRRHASGSWNGMECAVCMYRRPLVKLMPCGHKEFCEQCINKIIQKYKRSCPLCRTEITGYYDATM